MLEILPINATREVMGPSGMPLDVVVQNLGAFGQEMKEKIVPDGNR